MNKKLLLTAILALQGATQASAGWWVDSRSNTLSNAKEGFYTYHSVRTAYIQDVDGYAARTNALSTRVKNWVLNWAVAKTLTDQATGSDMQSYELQLAETYRKQIKDLDSIYSDAMKLRMELINAKNKLGTVVRLSYEPDRYESEYRLLLTAIDQLTTQIDQVQLALTKLMDDLRTSTSSVNGALIARLRIGLYGQGVQNLEQILAKVNGILEADARLEALLNVAIQKKYEFDAAFLKMRFFAAQRAGTSLIQSNCPDLTAKMASDTGSTVAKEAYLKELEKICTTTRGDLEFLQSKGAAPVTASSIIKKRMPRAKLKCLSDKPGLHQCGMVNWLGGVTEAQILSYDNKKLEALEKAWDLAEGVPQ